MSRPPRIDGFSYLGPNRYFVTFCTFDRRDLFTDIALGQSIVLQFRRTCREKKFALLAYCLMPDHVHLLVEGRSEASDLRHLIKSMKQSSGQRFAAQLNYRLWQDGFHDRVLRKDDDAKKIAKYIVENPTRAGLVQSPLDYPLSGSAVWTLEELVDSLW
jgi:REP-associated tyrosine transposase